MWLGNNKEITTESKTPKISRCEFLMCCALGRKCSLSSLRGGRKKSILSPKFYSFKQNNHLGWPRFQMSHILFIFNTSGLPGRHAAMERKCDGK